MRVEKTVFISYRRTNSFHAQAVYQALTARGYDVFLDYERIDSDAFDEIILRQIDARAHFLIILTPSALEGFTDPKDWLRREIEHAIETRRNLVPLMFEGFSFGDMRPFLTGKLELLVQYGGLNVPLQYFDEAMERLHKRFLSVPLDSPLRPKVSSQERQEVAHRQTTADAAPKPTVAQLSAEQYFERGNASFEHQDYAWAIRNYDEAIHFNPKFTNAYFNRGLAHFKQGDTAGAIRDHGEAIRLNPQFVQAYLNRGKAHHKQQDIGSAINDYSETIRLNPLNIAAYVNRGLMRETQRDYTGALCDFDEVIRLDPNLVEVYDFRAHVRYIQGDIAGAIRDLDEAIRLDPLNVDSYLKRAKVHSRQEDYAAAIRDYDEIIRLFPQSAGAFAGRAYERHMQKDYAGAIDDYSEAIRLDPQNAAYYLHKRVIAHLMQNDYAGVVDDIEAVLRTDPNDETARSILEIARKKLLGEK